MQPTRNESTSNTCRRRTSPRSVSAVRVMAARLCGVCVSRPACSLLEIDGRRYPACDRCGVEPVPLPPEPEGLRVRALRVLRRFDGEASVEELALAMGVDDAVFRATLSASLKRAIRDGEVIATGGRMCRRYSIAPGWCPPAPMYRPADSACDFEDELELAATA